jgi:hypothetical protein
MLDVVMWSLCTVPFDVAGNLLHVRLITGRQFGLLGREQLDDPASRAVQRRLVLAGHLADGA